MQILAAKVAKWQGWANPMQLQVLVDELPRQDEITYRHLLQGHARYKFGYYWSDVPADAPLEYDYTNGLYLGLTPDGYVEWLTQTWDHSGFAGRTFDIRLTNGKWVTLKGPWSSSGFNKVFQPHAMEVDMVDNLKSFRRGYTFCAAKLALPVVQKAFRELRELGPFQVVRHYYHGGGDCFYTVEWRDCEKIKSNLLTERWEVVPE